MHVSLRSRLDGGTNDTPGSVALVPVCRTSLSDLQADGQHRLGIPSVLVIARRSTILDVPARRVMRPPAAQTRKCRRDDFPTTTMYAVRLSRTSARIFRPSISMTRAPQQRLSQAPTAVCTQSSRPCESVCAAACCALLRRGLRTSGAWRAGAAGGARCEETPARGVA